MDKFEELKKYQEEQIDKIREYVFAQLGHSERSYAVETYLCRKDETDKLNERQSKLRYIQQYQRKRLPNYYNQKRAILSSIINRYIIREKYK